MRTRHEGYLSTPEAAREIGMSSQWIRDQIDRGLLPAIAVSTGVRKVYRIRKADWKRFLDTYRGPADDPRFDRSRT